MERFLTRHSSNVDCIAERTVSANTNSPARAKDALFLGLLSVHGEFSLGFNTHIVSIIE